MEKQIYQRITDYIRMKRIKPAELARILGISSTNVYGYLQGTSKAPMSFVALFLESFPDVSAEWLLRGNGEMLLPPKKSHYLEMAEKISSSQLMASEDVGLTARIERLTQNQIKMQSQLDLILQQIS